MSRPAEAAIVDCCGADFRVAQISVRAPRPGELLVRLVAAGLCHTDIVCRLQHIPTPTPIVLGHEGVGIVVECPSGSGEFQPGDAVLLTYTSCGHCENCALGKPFYCATHRANFGTKETGYTESATGQPLYSHFFGQSSHATFCLCFEENALKLDRAMLEGAGIPLKQLAPLACGVQTGAGAVLNSLRPAAGSSIAVFGTGAVGLSAIMAARVAGCGIIVGVDIHASRLQLASELGATHTVNSANMSPADLVAELQRLADGREIGSQPSRGGLDCAVDSTGVPAVLRSAFEALRPTGTCVLVGGSKPGSIVELPMDKILLGRTLKGCIQGESVARSFIPRLLLLHVQGRLPFDKLITYYEGGLSDLNQAAQDSLSGKSIKPVIVLSQG